MLSYVVLPVNMGKKRIRHCATCDSYHEKPTGIKCKKIEVVEGFNEPPAMDNAPLEPELMGAVGGLTDVNNNPRAPHKDNFMKESTDERLSAIENLVQRMAKVVLHETEDQLPRRAAVPSRSSSSDSSRSISPKDRVPRGQRKLISQTRHVNPGETLNTFDSLMVITFKTLIELNEKGLPINGLLYHGLVMAEKSASGAYVDRASISYDAAKYGLNVFENPCNEDLIRHYSLENSRRFDSRMNGGHKKKKNLCFRFNSEAGCHSKDCGFAHKCSICKLEGHSMKTCMSSDKNKNQK